MPSLSQIIEEEYNNFFTTKNTTEQGRIFLKWFLENIESDTIPTDDVEDCLVGRKYDCGIDAYYYNEENKILRLYQGKFKTAGGDLTDIEKKFGIDLIEKLSNEDSKKEWLNTKNNFLDRNLYFALEECAKIIFIYATTCGEIKMNDFQNQLSETIFNSQIIEDVIVYVKLKYLED